MKIRGVLYVPVTAIIEPSRVMKIHMEIENEGLL